MWPGIVRRNNHRSRAIDWIKTWIGASTTKENLELEMRAEERKKERERYISVCGLVIYLKSSKWNPLAFAGKAYIHRATNG